LNREIDIGHAAAPKRTQDSMPRNFDVDICCSHATYPVITDGSGKSAPY
jgi:hypothetical protein